jgi:hypothetical protein
MATMKEWKEKLKEFWTLVLGYGLLASVIWLGLYGCVWGFRELSDKWNSPSIVTAPPAGATPAILPTKCNQDHRFEKTETYPISLRADIALDTCSGKLCKTWSWVSKIPNSAYATYEDLPVCSELPDVKP